VKNQKEVAKWENYCAVYFG